MATKFWDMNRNRSYTEVKIDNVMRVISCKTNCQRCYGRFVIGTFGTPKQGMQCQCVKQEDIGVFIAGNITLTRKDN